MSASRVPPNGGWGWIVVIGVFVCNMTNQALFSVFGLLFGDALEAMGLETTGVSVISNTMNAVQNFSGLLSGSALKLYGPRAVALIGGVLVSAGMVLSALAVEPWQVLLSWGCLVGMGFGFLLPATFLVVSAYFTTRRGQAVGLSLAGTGVGQIALPHVVNFLLGEYGFHGAVLLLGGAALHAVPGALLFQPVRWHSKPPGPTPDSCDSVCKEGPENPETEPLRGRTPANEIESSFRYDSEKKIISHVNEDAETAPASIWRRVVAAMDLDLLWNGPFMNLAIGAALVYTANACFSMIFPFFLRESAGMTVEQTATCMSLLSGMDLLARLVLPALTARLRCGAKEVLLIGALTTAASRSVMAQLGGFPALAVMSAVSGFCRSAIVLNQNLILAEHVPPARLPAALGLAMVVKGVSTLSVGTLLGMVRDSTGSYPLFIHALSGLVGVACLSWTLECVFCSTQLKSPRK